MVTISCLPSSHTYVSCILILLNLIQMLLADFVSTSGCVYGWKNNCVCRKPPNLCVADELLIRILVLNEIVSYCCSSVEG